MPSFPRIVLMVTSWYTWFAAYVRMRNQYALRLSRNIASQPALAFSRPSDSVQPQHHASATRARPMVTLAGTHGTTRVRPLLPLACLPAAVLLIFWHCPSPSPYDVGEHSALSLGCFVQHQMPCYPRKHALMHRARAMDMLLLHTFPDARMCFKFGRLLANVPFVQLCVPDPFRISLQLFHSAFVSLHRSDA
ncbi:uncharacterized protein IWZ02DRAFT_119572 [Phyllosticta citriasiana]|uniref:Secreted protein n=1 Tax=Phyllosticta citriasiana TaxID=595635 RepID=A0ABR1KVS6_9PEZI